MFWVNLFQHIPLFIQITVSGGTLIYAHAYLASRRQLGSKEASEESNKILRDLNEDLKAELANRQGQHEKEVKTLTDSYQKQIVGMQAQINGLSEQVISLRNANTILQNTVTGKDILLEIQRKIDAFKPYVDNFSKIIAGHEETSKKLDLLLESRK